MPFFLYIYKHILRGAHAGYAHRVQTLIHRTNKCFFATNSFFPGVELAKLDVGPFTTLRYIYIALDMYFFSESARCSLQQSAIYNIQSEQSDNALSSAKGVSFYFVRCYLSGCMARHLLFILTTKTHARRVGVILPRLVPNIRSHIYLKSRE